uniref:Uncharacterized protein n=1 Tax=Aegilops tauschii subsp. strangulata TaxID=200361 RepID=A0A453PJZ9_AEGTS
MSSRRSSRGAISDEEVNELMSKLQSLLPNSRRRGSSQVTCLSSQQRCTRTLLYHSPAS